MSTKSKYYVTSLINVPSAAMLQHARKTCRILRHHWHLYN